MKTHSNDIRRSSLLSVFIILASLALITVDACQSDKSTAPATEATQMMKVWGDSQAALVNGAIPGDLIVKIGVDEGPGVKDVPVHFELLSGDAALTPSEAHTDANGLARTRVSLGETPREYTVQATADGYDTVVFTGMAVPPVTTSYSISPGEIRLTWSHTPITGFRCLSIVRTGESQTIPPSGDTLLVDSTGLVSTFVDLPSSPSQTYNYEFNVQYGERYRVTAGRLGANNPTTINLPSDAYDLAFDSVRNWLYIATPYGPDINITVVSLGKYEIIGQHAVRGAFNVCLSQSGDILYVPSHGTAALVLVDPDTWQTQDAYVGALTVSRYTQDAIEFRPGRVLTVADFDPWYNTDYNLPHPVEYRSQPRDTVIQLPFTGEVRTSGADLQLSADSGSIFMVSKSSTALVVTKFNIEDNSLPFAALSYSVEPSPTPLNFGVSRTTGSLYLSNGAVLDSANLDEVGNTGISGPVSMSPDGTTLYAVEQFSGSLVDSLRVIDAVTLQTMGSMPLPAGVVGIWASPLDNAVLYVSSQQKLLAVKVDF